MPSFQQEDRVLTADEVREAESFQMPVAYVGMPVIWYKFAVRDKRRSDLAFIQRVGSRNVGLYTSSGVRLDSVRHVDDPKLKLNSEQREQGAWDYTEHQQWMNDKFAELSGKLAELEKSVSAAVCSKARKVDKE